MHKYGKQHLISSEILTQIAVLGFQNPELPRPHHGKPFDRIRCVTTFHLIEIRDAQRDAQLGGDALETETNPNYWSQPGFQPWLFGSDVIEEMKKAAADKSGLI